MGWNELMKKANVSSATLSRNVNQLMEQGKISKEIDSDNNVVYTNLADLTELKDIYNVPELIDLTNSKLKLFKKLDKLGVFDKKINEKDILDFLDKKDDNLTPDDLIDFLNEVERLLHTLRVDEIGNVKINLRINVDKKDVHKRLKKEKQYYDNLK